MPLFHIRAPLCYATPSPCIEGTHFMSIIDIVRLAAAILTLSAVFGYINHRWL